MFWISPSKPVRSHDYRQAHTLQSDQFKPVSSLLFMFVSLRGCCTGRLSSFCFSLNWTVTQMLIWTSGGCDSSGSWMRLESGNRTVLQGQLELCCSDINQVINQLSYVSNKVTWKKLSGFMFSLRLGPIRKTTGGRRWRRASAEEGTKYWLTDQQWTRI